MRKTSAPRPQVPPPPGTPEPATPRSTTPKFVPPQLQPLRRPTPPAPEVIFEASEIGLLLEPDDEILQPSAVGMVLELDAATRRPAPRLSPEVAFSAEASRHNWYPAPAQPERRWDLVETVETDPRPDPLPAVRRVTPRKNPYRAPESQWDARIDELVVPRRRRFALWTAVSAGVSAVVCCVAFLVAVPENDAPESDAADSEPIVIGYDADLLEPPQPEIAVAGIADDGVADRRSHALALALRGRTNMLAGRTKQALSQFHEALEYNAQNRLALAQLGEWHLERGRAGKAAEYLRRAVRVEPRDGKAHSLLGRAYEQLGRPQKAQYHYRAAEKHGVEAQPR